MQKSFTNGLEFNANYVWGKSMDFQDSDHKATGEMGNNPQIDYGRSGLHAEVCRQIFGHLRTSGR